MTLIEELLSQSKLGRQELLRESLIVSVTEQIWRAMNASDMSKADLARALETSKANVTQLLSGQRNMTLATLADLANAVGVTPVIHLSSQNAVYSLGDGANTAHAIRVVGDPHAVAGETMEQSYMPAPHAALNRSAITTI
jgi:plasmid maintenance system antidote protein VapI